MRIDNLWSTANPRTRIRSHGFWDMENQLFPTPCMKCGPFNRAGIGQLKRTPTLGAVFCRLIAKPLIENRYARRNEFEITHQRNKGLPRLLMIRQPWILRPTTLWCQSNVCIYAPLSLIQLPG